MNTDEPPVTIITPRGLTSLAEWRELWAARDLARFLVLRDLKTRYAQSVLGLGWAVVQPLFTTGVLTMIFGNLMNAPSDGVPYAFSALAAVVLWTFFQNSANDIGNCLGVNIGVMSKVYFPRLVLPLAAVVCRAFDLVIMLTLLALMLVVSHGSLLRHDCHLQLAALWVVPLALGLATLAALALGLWLAGLSVQYRDVRVAQGLLFQLLMYASPVIYPSSQIYSSARIPAWVPGAARELYFLNPLAGAIDAMRACLYGKQPISYAHLALGAAVTLVALVGGLWCFRRAENVMVDVA